MPLDLERALLAMNASWSGELIYGSDHPVVARHAEDAASAFRAAVAHDPRARVLVVPGRIVAHDQVLESGATLLGGLFGRMGNTCPDCLLVSGGTTGGDVRRLIHAMSVGSPTQSGFIIGPFTLQWAHAQTSTGQRAATGADGFHPQPIVQDFAHAWRAAETGDPPPMGKLEELAGEIASAVAGDSATLLPLARLKLHDEYTFVHAINVGLMSSALCEAVGLSRERTRHITLGAMLHDVGKRVMPATIINKPGKLNDAERRVLVAHPAAGVQILAGSHHLPSVVLTVTYEHHMNMDGTGYPNRPKTRAISLPSQIVHVADVFDALRTHRPYREALPVATAMEIMGEEAGRCYDRDLFEVFRERVVGRFATPQTHEDRGSEAA